MFIIYYLIIFKPASEDMEKTELSYIASRNIKWYRATLEDRWTVSLRTKHALTIQPSNCTLEHLSQRKDNLFTQKPMQKSLW